MKKTILPTKSAGSTFPFGSKEVRSQRNTHTHGDGASAKHTVRGIHAAPKVEAKAVNFGKKPSVTHKSKLS